MATVVVFVLVLFCFHDSFALHMSLSFFLTSSQILPAFFTPNQLAAG